MRRVGCDPGEGPTQAARTPVPRVSVNEYVNNFAAIVSLAREHKASIVVIGAPYRDSKTNPPEAKLMTNYRTVLKSAMEQSQTPYLEILELTEAAGSVNEGFFGELIHPNHMGHRLMASELLKLMNQQKLLGDLRHRRIHTIRLFVGAALRGRPSCRNRCIPKHGWPRRATPTMKQASAAKLWMEDLRMSLSKQIVADLTASMKAQDASRTSTLRMVKAAMMNRQIEKGSELDDDDMQKLLRSLVKQRRDSIEQFEKAGRQELVDKEKAEIDVIETYLPQAASREEIEQAVAAAIAETGASSMKDMGKVMKSAQAALAGKNADGRIVSEVVKAKLS